MTHLSRNPPLLQLNSTHACYTKPAGSTPAFAAPAANAQSHIITDADLDKRKLKQKKEKELQKKLLEVNKWINRFIARLEAELKALEYERDETQVELEALQALKEALEKNKNDPEAFCNLLESEKEELIRKAGFDPKDYDTNGIIDEGKLAADIDPAIRERNARLEKLEEEIKKREASIERAEAMRAKIKGVKRRWKSLTTDEQREEELDALGVEAKNLKKGYLALTKASKEVKATVQTDSKEIIKAHFKIKHIVLEDRVRQKEISKEEMREALKDELASLQEKGNFYKKAAEELRHEYQELFADQPEHSVSGLDPLKP